MSSVENVPNGGRLWPWAVLMAVASLWYAWPQFFYSLYIGYDLMRTFLPAWASRLQPLLGLLAR